MAYIYRNITTSGATNNLIVRDTNRSYSGNINKINISNNSANPVTVNIDYHDGTNSFYLIKNVVIPAGVALVLDDCGKFNSAEYSLRIHNTGSSPDLTVIIN